MQKGWAGEQTHGSQRFKNWPDNWQNVAARDPALWEQSLLEFAQFAAGKLQLKHFHNCVCALKLVHHWRAGLPLTLFTDATDATISSGQTAGA